MMWITRDKEDVRIRGIKELKKGDIVRCSNPYNEFVPATVTLVRIVGCAVIITVKADPLSLMVERHFVGYHTSDNAFGGHDSVLTGIYYQTDRMEKAIRKATEKAKETADLAEALNAMKVLKNWFANKDN